MVMWKSAKKSIGGSAQARRKWSREASRRRPGRMPLGVKDEWEWLRVGVAPEPFLVLVALGAVGLYALFAAAGLRSITRGKMAAWWLVGLVPMAVLTVIAILMLIFAPWLSGKIT